MRSSIAASVTRSSARVSPRSVMRVGGDLGDDVVERRRVGLDGAGAAHVADGAVADARRERRLAVGQLDEVAVGVEHPVAAEDLALVGEVDRRDLETPRRGCTATRRARSSWRSGRRARARPCGCARCRGSTARGAGSWDPTGRSRRGSEKMRSLARARSSSRRAPPKAASKPCSSIASSSVVVWRRVARRARAASPRRRARRRSTPARWRRSAAHRAPRRGGRGTRSTSGKLCPVSTCISGNGKPRRPERLLGQAQQHDRVLAAGEQQHRPLELGGDLAHDVDRLGLERTQM